MTTRTILSTNNVATEFVWATDKRKSTFVYAQNVRVLVQSIIRAFTLHSYILKYAMIPLADSVGPDQTVRMRGCAVWSWPSLFAYAQDTFSHGAANMEKVLNFEIMGVALIPRLFTWRITAPLLWQKEHLFYP